MRYPELDRLRTRWQRLRLVHLRQQPLCVYCEAQGMLTLAQVVDHIQAHRGDAALYLDPDNLQSLCKRHHDSTKASMERSGWALGRPAWLRPAKCNLVIVCGAAGSGKSSYARANAAPDDTVIDLDEIIAQQTGLPLYARRPGALATGLMRRNKMLAALADRSDPGAWFVVSAPTVALRAWWQSLLRPTELVLMPTTEAECIRRIKGDPQRAGDTQRHIAVCRQWFAAERGVALPARTAIGADGAPTDPMHPWNRQPATY